MRLQLLQLIDNRAYTVAPSAQLRVTIDPEDNMFLECAEAARADYLITGNRKHLPKFWRRTAVITAREFIDLVAPYLLG